MLNDGHSVNPMLLTWDESTCNKSDSGAGFAPHKQERKCSICSACSVGPNNSLARSAGKPLNDDDDKENPMAIVPVQKLEAASSTISVLLRELPESKPGWPLLRRAIISNKISSYNSQVRQISVVQWAMRLPSRYYLSLDNSTRKDNDSDSDGDQSSALDAESGAIVAVGSVSSSSSSSPDSISRSLPKELEGFHEKYSASCRLFKFKELVSATSNFRQGFLVTSI